MATRALLLDTHVWLWLNGEVDRLASEALDLLNSPQSELYLSSASAWEIGIKCSNGKLTLPLPPEIYIPTRLLDTGVNPLPIRVEHALRAATLPLHHKDPFDRMLVAQAQVENLELMTVDRHLASYDVSLVWAD
ncbi:MAG TPA: type II toxin-antitoxin system VapC family toxin [Thermoanaerobaculia bacterium]|jgi:PIN domain nuclease of toxin-antitoxin system|nr:type II toxin-antitoxin system VapC family toxin [Thermoanaerobaculia bacterium]